MSPLPSHSGDPEGAPHILVVEDELLVRFAVCEFLRDAGFKVVEAYNADEAICILNSGVKIDLMITDVRMPGSMDGLGLLTYSRQMFPELPVIVTSGHLSPSEAKAKGAANFLAKPYSIDHAITLVQLELAKAR